MNNRIVIYHYTLHIYPLSPRTQFLESVITHQPLCCDMRHESPSEITTPSRDLAAEKAPVILVAIDRPNVSLERLYDESLRQTLFISAFASNPYSCIVHARDRCCCCSLVDRIMRSSIPTLRPGASISATRTALYRPACASVPCSTVAKNARGGSKQQQRYASSVEYTSANTSDAPSNKDTSANNGGARHKKSRLFRFSRFSLISGAVVWAGVEADKRYNSAAVTRSIRTGWMG